MILIRSTEIFGCCVLGQDTSVLLATHDETQKIHLCLDCCCDMTEIMLKES